MQTRFQNFFFRGLDENTHEKCLPPKYASATDRSCFHLTVSLVEPLHVSVVKPFLSTDCRLRQKFHRCACERNVHTRSIPKSRLNTDPHVHVLFVDTNSFATRKVEFIKLCKCVSFPILYFTHGFVCVSTQPLPNTESGRPKDGLNIRTMFVPLFEDVCAKLPAPNTQ